MVRMRCRGVEAGEVEAIQQLGWLDMPDGRSYWRRQYLAPRSSRTATKLGRSVPMRCPVPDSGTVLHLAHFYREALPPGLQSLLARRERRPNTAGFSQERGHGNRLFCWRVHSSECADLRHPAYPPPEQIPEKGFRPDRARPVRTQHKLTSKNQMPKCAEEQILNSAHQLWEPTNSGRRQVARRESHSAAWQTTSIAR
jgi:hypothetical protein